MIYFKYEGHDYKYDLDNILNIFYCEENHENDYFLENSLLDEAYEISIKTILYDANRNELSKDFRKIEKKDRSKLVLKKLTKKNIKLSIYDTLLQKFKSKSKWGILVGIRPVKIVHEILDENKNMEDAIEELKSLMVSEEKIELLVSIAKIEREKIYPLNNEISLYISIPFCPSRCYYCSFPSNDINNGKYKIEDYIEKLKIEIIAIGELKKELKLKIDCIYFGGGTPSILTADQIENLMSVIDKSIGTKNLKEFTFEAGRSDTITEEKLSVLKKYNVDRICINPQTFNNKTLVNINRKHTIEEFYYSYEIIKKYNFKSVNFDLILGLKGENYCDMENSINAAIALRPENITVHTLSVKRSSKLNEIYSEDLVANEDDVEMAVDYSKIAMENGEYHPYYMYRQKKMIGNLENVGYSQPEFDSLYNMRIMEERHTIIAIGAGSTSKICYESENRFERHGNPKGLDVYLSSIDKYLDKHVKIIKDRYQCVD